MEMDQKDQQESKKPPSSLPPVKFVRPVVAKSSSNLHYRMVNGTSPASLSPSSWFEVRLFYIRISPCAIDTVPDHLTLRHVGRELGVSLEINGALVPASEPADSTLRRDRVDKEAAEVTYVCTDGVRVTGCVDIELYERDNLILCGSLESLETDWGCNGNVVGQKDPSKTGWGLECYAASSAGSSAFFQPKLGVSSPSMEVYIAGCCSGSPLILTRTVNITPRKKQSKLSLLDAIPEGEEDDAGKEHKIENEFLMERKLQLSGVDSNGYESDVKFGHGYGEEVYIGEDGQLTWFNAGVRVGVGIGLGMCLGIGIGVGLLMRSYQATTRNFRRRFR